MSYGYSAKLIYLNKRANGWLLGVRLGRACIRNNIPVAEVAEELGVSRQTVYNWFIGARSPQSGIAPDVRDYIDSLY
jgi:hypothetical protein